MHKNALCIRTRDMTRYSNVSKESVRRAMKKRKQGTLVSGRSGKRVIDKKQAIAIGLSEARRKGARVPGMRKGYAKE